VADLDSELQNCIKSDTDNNIGILIDCMSRMTNKYFSKVILSKKQFSLAKSHE